MTLEIPDFETQMRGFDRDAVTDYIARVHHKIELLQGKINSLEETNNKTRFEREQLAAEIGRMKNEAERKVAEAGAERDGLAAEVAQLRGQLEQVAGPVDSVEGMSDRIARMMRIASEEARRTKELARQDAEALTGELREQVDAASQDRSAASEALAHFQASTNTRRDKILSAAMAEADEILRIAREERSRVTKEIEEAERSRRELYQRLTEEDERNRRSAQEALDEQIKLAWEEDERNRHEAQRRLDQQMKTAWEQAGDRISQLDRDARLEASTLMAATKRDAKSLTDKTTAEVDLLLKERSGIVTHLTEIRNWIETAVGDVATPAPKPAAAEPAPKPAAEPAPATAAEPAADAAEPDAD